jgi:hypothetical protein
MPYLYAVAHCPQATASGRVGHWRLFEDVETEHRGGDSAGGGGSCAHSYIGPHLDGDTLALPCGIALWHCPPSLKNTWVE